MYKYVAIIFDFDGVLVESVDVKTKAFALMYAAYGDDIVKKVIDYHLINGGVSRFDKFRYYEETLLGNSLDTARERALGEQFSSLVIDAVVKAQWVPGAKEFLDDYHKKIPFFVASGTPDSEIKEIVARRDMSHYFISVHGTPAKKEEIITLICRENCFSSDRVLMVGDALSDYEGAKRAGVAFIARRTHNIPFPAQVVLIPDLCGLFSHVLES